MHESLIQYGLPALFLVSFLAATLLPLGSEWLLAALVIGGTDPTLAVAVATGGNTLGALTTWAIGLWGGPWLIEKVLRISEQQQRQAETLYRRWGVWSLLLAWTPVIGDPLCLIGGLFRVRFLPFTLLVTLGKIARYTMVAFASLSLA